MNHANEKFDAIILGAGPAGLAAALKLSENKQRVLILEKENEIGGLSKTTSFKNFLFDFGPHRFFTKSKEVENFWKESLGKNFIFVKRLTRIYYRNKFFYYPIKIFNVIRNLGITESILIVLSLLKSKLFPCKSEDTVEEWVSNRFGKKLYEMFFKTYNEKLWGIPCDKMTSEFTAQRIKGLSFSETVKNAIFPTNKRPKTLIDEFSYPKYGSGEMYDSVAKNIKRNGGRIMKNVRIIKVCHDNSKINKIKTINPDGTKTDYEAENIISSIPITELANILFPRIIEADEAAQELSYRSTIFVNLLFNIKSIFPDNWIYIHSDEAKIGRISNPKNFSSELVPNSNQTSLIAEYFCDENDEMWEKSDSDLKEMALYDLGILKIIRREHFIDGFVVKVPKTYPVYGKGYSENVATIKKCLNCFKNLQLIGRNGMFKYNNMDHSILTGLRAAENVLGSRHDLWAINEDSEYQETKKSK